MRSISKQGNKQHRNVPSLIKRYEKNELFVWKHYLPLNVFQSKRINQSVPRFFLPKLTVEWWVFRLCALTRGKKISVWKTGLCISIDPNQKSVFCFHIWMILIGNHRRILHLLIHLEKIVSENLFLPLAIQVM